MKKWRNACLSLICFCILFVLIFQYLSRLIPFVDVRQSRVWQDIYENQNSISYLFLGSSHVYCGINPMQIQEKTGEKAVLVSSGMQTLTESYYCLEEALKYQKPKAVYVDLYGAYKEFTETNYTNLDCMRLSFTKVKLVREAFADTRLIDGLFPLIREHSNWKDFENSKTNIENKHPKSPYEYGFSGIDSVMTEEQYEGIANWEQNHAPLLLREADIRAIEKMKELGEKKQVRIVFILIPWLDEFTERINFGSFLGEVNRATGGVLVLSKEEYEKLGLSRETFIEDKISDNQHLNLRGAEIYTDYLIKKSLSPEQ